jgi:rhamnogalacturonyl hydrolase YesR
MKRRFFFKSALSLGSIPGISLLYPNQKGNEGNLYSQIDKVKSAMLSMQRYAWEQGVASQSLLELGETELVILMAKDAVLRQQEDGRLAVVGCFQGVTDPAANGESVLFAAKVTGDPVLKKGAEKMLNYLLEKAPKTSSGILYHISDKPQVWIDSLYMAPPFIAVSGYPKEAVKQIKGFRDILWNKDKKLFSQIWDDKKKSFIQKECWGVGNGWAAAGITRVIKSLPLEMAHEKKVLTEFLKEIIDGCLNHIRMDGFFHNIVDDPKTFVETNLGQMLAYSIYRGVKGGWLEPSYIKHAEKMRKAAHSKVDKYGFVRDVCGAPEFESPGTAVEGQAFFILMEAARRDFRKK